jgi:4-carboxymuconolactone decarboxylase
MTDWPKSESFERGIQTRRAVLGDAYVDRSLSSADDFTRDIQTYATEVCWDRIWNRDGLARRERSILNLGMIAALNRPHELKAHVRGALNNGLTKDELREIFLQSAIYIGLPAALDSYRLAKDVLAEMAIA